MATNIRGNTPLCFDTFHNIIDGELSCTAETRHTVNPATLENNPDAPLGTVDDVNRAVRAANRAADAWAKVPWDERACAIRSFADTTEQKSEDFVRILQKETGKPMIWARHELATCVKYLRGFCRLSLPEEVIEDAAERKVVTRYTPLGVIVGIVPWNYPVQLSCVKMGAALLTGNTYIWKPSPHTPYCSIKLAELAQRFFPPGVVQILSGDNDLGPLLTEHPDVHMVSFTGSIPVGKKIMESCSKTLKRVVLELGGNDPAIVCKDVNPADVAAKIGFVCFCHAGQICINMKRIYVHEAVYDDVLAAIVGLVQTLKLGLGEDAYMGPITTKEHFEYLKSLLEDVERRGFNVAIGSTKPLSDMKGYYLAPTIIDNPPDDARIVVEEQLGPVLPFLKWRDETDVITRANNTKTGLGASVWTRDMEQAERLRKKLKVGNVWINTHAEIQTNITFAGHRESGFGVAMGINGLKACCNAQSIYTRPADAIVQY